MLHMKNTDKQNDENYYFIFQVYKKKTELAKKDYLKQLAAYRATLVSKVSFKLIIY